MSELEEQFNAILSSPEAMAQIMALAGSLSGGSGGGAGEASPSPSSEEGESQAEDAASSPLQGLESMEALSGLTSHLDPDMLTALLGLAQSYSQGDPQQTALLDALRPFLSPQRQQKLDRAIQLSRMSRVIRTAYRMFRDREEGRNV